MVREITSTFILVGPLPYLIAGLLIGVGADRHKSLERSVSTKAAWFALLCAIGAGVGFVLTPQHDATIVSVSLPAHFVAFKIATLVNPLTLIMFLLVSYMGLIVSRFSSSYMAGDIHEGRFHRWLSLTLGAFLLLITADNMWEFWIFFVAASVSLHKLLVFYKEPPLAVVAARKKFILSRVADVSLFTAFVLIATNLKVSSISAAVLRVDRLRYPLPTDLQIAAGLVVLTAILKSGVFPLHGWLIQVMEAPTQVSALLHAGLIYTGAFLLLRVSSLIAHVQWSWTVLVIVGLGSILVSSLAMMAETNIKESLAYSTSAQLGFMMMECGLGLYSVAVLHIVAHSVYKAHAFLSSGSVVDNFRGATLQKTKADQTITRALLAIVVSGVVTFFVGMVFGVRFQSQPTLLAVGVILTMAMSQLLLQGLNQSARASAALLVRVAVISIFVCGAYFALHDLSTLVLASSVPSDHVQADRVPIWLLTVVGVSFTTLLLVQQLLPRLSATRFGKSLYVGIYNGLYVDLFLSQVMNLDATKISKSKLSSSSKHSLSR
jgi:NAD(P)H-quinone oxidoreductase subunit 5